MSSGMITWNWYTSNGYRLTLQRKQDLILNYELETLLPKGKMKN